MTRTGTSVYPGTIDSFTRIGTTNYEDESGYEIVHVENEAMDALEKIEAAIGTTAGTSVLKNVVVGQFVATTAGTEILTNKTINNAVIGTSALTGGTVTTATINTCTLGTPAITGGTATSITLTSPKVNENVALTATATQLNAVGTGGVTTRLLSKTISFTRDLAGTAGDVSYTSVGFQPTSLQVISVVSESTMISIIYADSARACKGMYCSANNVFRPIDDYLCVYSDATSVSQLGVLKSYDADGFTITWSKSGSPTGTMTCKVLCLR